MTFIDMIRYSLWLVFIFNASNLYSQFNYIIPEFPEKSRLAVVPIFFLPADVHLSEIEINNSNQLLRKHLEIAQNHYSDLLITDTFKILDEKVRVYKSPEENSFFTKFNNDEKVKSSHRILRELYEWNNDDRYKSNLIYLVVYVRPSDQQYTGEFNMLGGARTVNGVPNSGGGYVEMEYTSLINDEPYPFQSTLVHELGHAFGLFHSDCLGYSLSSSTSIMSYNTNHHSRGIIQSEEPGDLLPEEYFILSLNKRAFPNFEYRAEVHNPQNKIFEDIQKCFLGPIGDAVGKFKYMPDVGYELYFNGKQVNGPESSFYSFEQAKANCEWNLTNNKGINIECRYNGIRFYPGDSDMKITDWILEIKFVPNNLDDNIAAAEMINKAIEYDSEFLASIGLTGNLEKYILEFYVTVKESVSEFNLDLSPKSGEGHDFIFSISKFTGRINKESLSIGEVIPEPEDEE